MSAVYRVQQFIRAARAWVRPDEVENAAVGCNLPPAAVRLFQAMSRYDQKHALIVLRTLQEQGHDEADLLAAALLHDVGKSVPRRGGIRLWHRVAAVLMRAVWPGLLERLGREDRGGWRRPFYVQQHHASLGADLAWQAGCSAVTVALIRRHEDPADATQHPADAIQHPEDAERRPGDDLLLAALQAADSTG